MCKIYVMSDVQVLHVVVGKVLAVEPPVMKTVIAKKRKVPMLRKQKSMLHVREGVSDLSKNV